MARLLLILLATAALWGTASAQSTPSLATLQEQAAKRFPQPVRVGDLIGHDVLAPAESQPVLGRVAAVTRRADGGLDVIVRLGGLLGIGARPIAVPVEAVALLGEHVALLGLTPAQLDALPTAPTPSAPLPPDTSIKVALVKPFH